MSGAEPEKLKIVLDGGLLFYTVPWEKGASYGDAVRCYLAYVKKHFPDPEVTSSYLIATFSRAPRTWAMATEIQ